MENNEKFFATEVFRKLANELRRRYYLNGDYGQTIGLQTFSSLDTDRLRALLGLTPIAWTKKKRLSITDLEHALKNSAFSWSIDEFVTYMTKKPLILKAEEDAQVAKRFERFCVKLDQIDRIFTANLSEPQLISWFNKTENNFEHFQIVAKALAQLPTEYTRMPVFAYQQTGNPHAFDDNQQAGMLLLQMLQSLSQLPETDDHLAAVEVKNQLLDQFYLLRDDINNYVAVKGLTAETDGKANQMWTQACIEQCSWNVPLKEILRMETIRPYQGTKLLIVENSGVYSILLDALPEIPMICSSGQFTYAVWRLLRKLVQTDTQMYYVGDLDPEGLVMAQSLLNRFPDNMKTVGMNLNNYHLASRPSTLTEQRLKQLRLIKEPSLIEIAEQIKETGQTAMQEGFLRELINELK
ncbi:TIGR02679 domain-containing protein [Amphibacillus indicireducens]|uniref:TIGR02679 family protein n=1 Tax=Amphibacillus indicireducens TaxID=1076330 RepID=A0ABP7V9G4_9BACI